jgi:hypothetical protein
MLQSRRPGRPAPRAAIRRLSSARGLPASLSLSLSSSSFLSSTVSLARLYSFYVTKTRRQTTHLAARVTAETGDSASERGQKAPSRRAGGRAEAALGGVGRHCSRLERVAILGSKEREKGGNAPSRTMEAVSIKQWFRECLK